MGYAPSNKVLERLGEETLRHITSHGKAVELPQGRILAEPLDRFDTVYFPTAGVVSFVVQVSSGEMIEAGMVGRDGVVGADEVVNDALAFNQVMVQGAGVALAIPAGRFKELYSTHGALRRNVAAFRHAFLAQVQQTGACNATHRIDARFCRWLLHVRDLAGDEFSLTQEFVAKMLGVQRASVSTEAHKLQKAGLISYTRGHIRVLNPEGLLNAACECHKDVKRYEDALFAFKRTMVQE